MCPWMEVHFSNISGEHIACGIVHGETRPKPWPTAVMLCINLTPYMKAKADILRAPMDPHLA